MYRFAPFLIFIGLLAGPLFGAEVEREFKAGEEILEAWRFAEAEAIAAKALKDNPKSATALEFDGRIKFYQGRYQEALTRSRPRPGGRFEGSPAPGDEAAHPADPRRP